MNVDIAITKLETLQEKSSNKLISLADKLYETNFSRFFKDMRSAYDGMKEKGTESISDSELERILTDLPLELFNVSEVLSNYKLHSEIAKLQTKQDMKLKLSEDDDTVEYDKLVQSVYTSVIARVESEISFSREFIMVLKKLWDARRATESVNPVKEISEYKLPEYTMPSNSKLYIK